jgi:hypothetical protein
VYAGTPVYSGGILRIPQIINTSDNSAYEDVTFQLNNGKWTITSGKVAEQAPVTGVNVVISGIIAEIVVEGYLPDGCSSTGDVMEAREGNTFHIVIPLIRPEGDIVCTQVVRQFNKVISIDISDLTVGEYDVQVNDRRTSFTLESEGTDSHNTVCCQINCCTCGPEYYDIYSFVITTPDQCIRPDNIVGGNCYTIVDMSKCTENQRD